ncbi:MAG: ATP synthase F1 subunit delta [Clostridia bacterium]|nr:ATP synthase F1 subunit delta [Clostridia bacterium]
MDKLAIEYGGGLFELAEEEGIADELLLQVRSLRNVLSENPEYIKLLNSHRISREEKGQLIASAFDGKVHEYLYNFICMMSDRGYFSFVPACLDRFEECYRDSRGIILVKVLSAVSLSEEQKNAICKSVEKKTGKKAEAQFIKDESLIAGLRVEADGKLFENSAKSKFEEIRRLLQTAVTGNNT